MGARTALHATELSAQGSEKLQPEARALGSFEVLHGPRGGPDEASKWRSRVVQNFPKGDSRRSVPSLCHGLFELVELKDVASPELIQYFYGPKG